MGLLNFRCCHLSHLLANTCIYVRLTFDLGARESTASDPAPLCTNIIVMDMDNTALLTRDGMLDCQLFTTSIAVPLHVKRTQIEEDVSIIMSFLCREYVSI